MGAPEPTDWPMLRLIANAALSMPVLGVDALFNPSEPIENETAAAKAEYP